VLVQYVWLITSPPGAVQSIATSMSVCPFSVCLYVRPHISNTTRPNSIEFSLCVLTMTVARSRSGGVATYYALPVLWMTSCFHTMELIRCVMCISKRRERSCLKLLHRFQPNFALSDPDRKVHMVCRAAAAKSAIYDCIVL